MEDEGELTKSRTQLKKEAIALQKIGEKLVQLSDEQLKRMDLPARLIDAIDDIRPMTSHGARRRQMQYIGSLMRDVDIAPIEQALQEIEQGEYQRAREFHRLEDWRDRLVDGDDEAMMEILDAFPEADRQRLGQLVRSARKEKQNNNPPKSARNLFRYLRELSESG
ncbi:ribosome biogenesis factor YjgA [uncultured Desulfosarcina sp.]|uniref:ribosome biogenesis factor YjgA n=1 Tax=uncultured Desulfosarcina sp. TaxID=218289 RepID=UPI0029C6F9D0|nr:ribosome biogenesis factor YjgA [uncultured Desulfosarcina sp.]